MSNNRKSDPIGPLASTSYGARKVRSSASERDKRRSSGFRKATPTSSQEPVASVGVNHSFTSPVFSQAARQSGTASSKEQVTESTPPKPVIVDKVTPPSITVPEASVFDNLSLSYTERKHVEIQIPETEFEDAMEFLATFTFSY